MNIRRTLKLADEFAKDYDKYVNSKYWHGPEMLFGLMYEYIQQGQLLLDIGIGTGLSSKPFYVAGLKIYGIDGSTEMLKMCSKKNITEELRQIDIANDRIKLNHKFDVVISYGIFHMIGNLSNVIQDITQLLKPGGILGFSVENFNPNKPDDYLETKTISLYQKTNPESGIEVFRHNKEYITKILTDNNFQIMKEFPASGAAMQIPEEIRKLTGEGSKTGSYIGAYPLK